MPTRNILPKAGSPFSTATRPLPRAAEVSSYGGGPGGGSSFGLGGFYHQGKWYANEAALQRDLEAERARLEDEQLQRGARASVATPRGSSYRVGSEGDISFQGSPVSPTRADAEDRALAGLQAVMGGGASGTLRAGGAGDTGESLEERTRRHQREDAEALRRQTAFDLFTNEVRAPSAPRVSPTTVDASNARAAAFARAKERSGQLARASLNSLYDLMAATGRSGSNVEAGAAGNLASSEAGTLGDLLREQAIQDAAAGQRSAEQQYTGEITQRGQDLAYRNSLLSLLRNLY